MSIKEELSKIVGEDNVTDSIEELNKYATDESMVHPTRPKCIVKPSNAEEVQKIVKWANQTSTPLIPVSSGPPHFRGDTVPSIGGTVIVEMLKMKKIVRIDTENRVAMLEPGVTFSELIPELTKKGLKLNLPLLPRVTKSVVGSMLEREPVIMPQYHWDIADPLACTEIIYGTGDKFRTGSAAGPGTLEEQWSVGAAQNEASGPLQADFYRLAQGAQGTMGIITWATARCEFLPSIVEPFLIGAAKIEDLMEFIHWVQRQRLVDDCLVLNNANLARILSRESLKDYESVKNTLPQWVLYYTITGYKYFPEEKVNYQTKMVSELAKSLHLEPLKVIGKASAFEMVKIFNKPPEEPYWKLKGGASCADIFFITDYDRLSGLIVLMQNIAQKYNYPLSDMGIYVQPIVQAVNYHCEFNLFFNPKNPVEVDRINNLTQGAIEPLANQGAFFSRPYGPAVDTAFRRDAITTISLRKIKRMYDPNNIMNPGKLCF